MSRRPPHPSYEELLQEFKMALGQALLGTVLRPTSLLADASLTLALHDIAYAIRQDRTTQYSVAKACAAFSAYAMKLEATPRPQSPALRSVGPVRSPRVLPVTSRAMPLANDL